ncbi:MAG: prepilin peptidase [Candidatus Nomurabacteria bacterium]|nr:MAG: prepilin peptidase [Candidatus Nomurabacteria bacterium]
MSGISISLILGLLGLFFGSFAGASVWRLRARQLRIDISEGEKVGKKALQEVTKIKKRSALEDRSVCLHCGHQLKWYDLIPIISWLSLQGRCRYCRVAIGWFEPAIELGVAAFFVVSYLFWPSQLVSITDITQFIIWLIAGVGLAILFVYDMRWFLLPNSVVFPLLGLGIINVLVVLADRQFAWSEIIGIFYGCAILSGLYYLIYILSRYKWVGFGDVKLGLVLALLLADWRLSALALFLANLIGTIIYLPLMARGSVKRRTHIPFGPLLIGGWFIAGLFGTYIIAWYLTFTLGTV